MLTIFTIPKPFIDPHIRLIQRNALRSWKVLHPEIEIFLIGSDPGVSETAKEFGVKNLGSVDVNQYGTPLLDSAFALARQNASHQTLMYVNADIIFDSSLIKALPFIPKTDFLAIGRRTDLDIAEEINFDDPDWAGKLSSMVNQSGSLHSWAGIDYFIFNKEKFFNLPPMAVGRVGWDNWTIAKARQELRYVIDCSSVVMAVHQNHTYTGTNTGAGRKTNPEARQNSSFIKNPAYAFTIEDANWKLTPVGPKRNRLCWVPFFKRSLKYLFKIK